MNKCKIVLLFALTFIIFSQVRAQQPNISRKKAYRPVHTYSIVARDPETGQMGVAVQSHWFSVGSLVTWAEAGVGAVATQSLVDVTYGKLGLDLMRAGRSATQTLEALKIADSSPEIRQVAMIDAQGNVAAHTGEKCIPDAGHIVGDNFSVQANLMLNKKVWPAMKQAYEKAEGDLADKMLAALEAAQNVGGDIRGKQSAAILIVKGESTGKPWEDRVMELRIEDHLTPIKELKRLVKLHRAYDHMNKGDLAIEHNDVEAALKEYGAAQALFPENLEMKFWHAVSLVNAERVDDSLPIFKEIFTKDPNWAILVPRLPGVDILPKDDAIIDKIMSIAPKGITNKNN
ncbi:DUF1028 domain-containing protein [candidate division KSB1 bacterium]|nr:DUF1028 domain-containing protein [candidate division KSB1 bacterium]